MNNIFDAKSPQPLATYQGGIPHLPHRHNACAAGGEEPSALKADRFFAKPLLQRLFFEKRAAAEPTCDICHKPIERKDFKWASATWEHSNDAWRITHHDCDLPMAVYYVALDQIATPRAALEKSIHLMGHIAFHEGWEDVIERLYPSTRPRRKTTPENNTKQ